METKRSTIRRILVPLDFSETGLLALDHAALMAKLFSAKLYLLHVIEVLGITPYPYNEMMVVRDLDEIESSVQGRLDELKVGIRRKYDVLVDTIIYNGRVSVGIAEAAKENKIDAIVMGTHGASGFEEYFIGSNAHKTVTLSPCPVISIQTNAKLPGFKNIILPIDNSLHSRQKVEKVIELAKAYDAKIHLLGLLDVDEDVDEKKFAIKLDSVEKAIRKSNVKFIRELIKGKNIAEEAMKYSQKVKGDLIAIMTDHESKMNGMFMGGLAKQIVNHSQIPVMSIRPVEGVFESVDLSAASPF